MNTHVNPDVGIRQVAPDVQCREVAVGANVTQLAASGQTIYAGLGDGRVVAVSAGQVDTLCVHKGAVTGLCVLSDGLVVSSGQDGRVLKGDTDLMRAKPDWITVLRSSRTARRIAVASGQTVDVQEDGQIIASIDDFPSTVSDVMFFGDGNRLAISHYGGISLWSLDRLAKPEKLDWAGSMTSANVSPDDRYVAGATQDREIHIWDLATGRDFRLGGYRTKVKAMGWTDGAPYLYTTGADALVAWGLAGDPGAFPPKEIGYAFDSAVSAVPLTAATHRMPAGFSNGSIILGEVTKGTAKIVRAATGQAITGLIDAGAHFCFGTKDGQVGVFSCPT